MICKHCGSELREGAAFCTFCGKPVEQDAVGSKPDEVKQPDEVKKPDKPQNPTSPAVTDTKVQAEEAAAVGAKESASSAKTTKGFGIASLVCSLVTPLGSCVGLPGGLLVVASIVMAIVSLVQSKKYAQEKNRMAIAGLIISCVWIVIGIPLTIMSVLGFFALGMAGAFE